MKLLWLLLGSSIMMLFVGLLVQSIMQPAGESLSLAIDSIGYKSVQTVKGVEIEMFSDTTTSNDKKLAEKEGSMNGVGEPSPTPSSSTVVGTVLFDYDDNEPTWYTVNDDVMGGISNSMVSTDTTLQRLTFSGNLSLENNGGFASVRSQWSDFDLTGYDGIVLRVRGDGKAYQFRVRTEETGSEIAYAALFETEAGNWKDIYISFAEMVPIYRGVVVGRAPTLDPGSIRSFGLMLANKQQGDFVLEVEMISAVVASNQQV